MSAEVVMGKYLTIARRHSLCDDDAQEAVARSFEIALRHRDRISHDPSGAERWMSVVVKHEAMRVRRARFRYASFDVDPRLDQAEPEIEEREPDPRLPAVREALGRLKPHYRLALVTYYTLEGDDRYHQMSRLTGWSYRTVARYMCDGRAAVRRELEAAGATA